MKALFPLLLTEILLISVGSFASDNDEGVVTIGSGKIRGRSFMTSEGDNATVFLGIPYAQDAEDDLRFRIPIKPLPWGEKILEVSSPRERCKPNATLANTEGGSGSNTCLGVDVLASHHCIDRGGCAVLVIVDDALVGSEFHLSEGEIEEQTAAAGLAARNIVVALIHYRQGPFGFLNLSPDFESSAPKNLALHDLLAGLQWVQDEISTFGGDPFRVTLLGHGFGAKLVDTLALSSNVTRMFQQLILSSGSRLHGATVISEDVNVEASWTFAKRADCVPPPPFHIASSLTPFSDPRHSRLQVERTLTCLRKKPQTDIDKALVALRDTTAQFNGPSIDDTIVFNSTFGQILSGRPQYPTLLASTSDTLELSSYLISNGKTNETRLKELCEHIGYDLWFEHKETVSRACFTYYKDEEKARHLVFDLSSAAATILTANSLSSIDNKVYLLKINNKDKLHRNKLIAILCPLHDAIGDFVESRDPSGEYPSWKPWEAANRTHFIFASNGCELRNSLNSTGYEGRAYDFWISFLGRFSGETMPMKYPHEFDALNIEKLAKILSSHHEQNNTDPMKTLAAQEAAFNIWSDFRGKQRILHLNDVRGVRSLKHIIEAPEVAKAALIHDSEEKPKSFFVKIVIVTILGLAVYGFYILLIECVSKKKRTNYESFQ